MAKRFAITIARTLGSDGGEIARRVAQQLNIRFIDKELLSIASSESGISEALFNVMDEKLNRRIFRQSTAAYRGEVYTPGHEDFLSNKNLFEYQSKVLRDIYNQGEPFIVVGRAGSFILDEFPNVVKVNVVASEQYCVENIMDRNCISESEAKKLIAKTNKYRYDFFKYFTGKEWGNPLNYDLCLNSSTLGIENCVQLIVESVKAKGLL
ncbi:AAA family ATPase [Treponema sp.]|uniref:cytidylate kinase-like family protein n=1 Tax=Treponema sp. TaxID=166 RepID=UPI00388F9D08